MNIDGNSVGPQVMGNTCSAVRQRVPWIQDQDDDEMANQTPIMPGSPYTRIIRHYSVESEVPDNTITNLFPLEDNYVTVGSTSLSSLRSPKSLTQFCIEQVCRSLPMLDGVLPPGLPQEIVDKIVQCLISHSALNGTTLRALKFCEVGSLSLANCRGVTDAWFRSLNEDTLNHLRQSSIKLAPSKDLSDEYLSNETSSEDKSGEIYTLKKARVEKSRTESPAEGSCGFESSLYNSPASGDSSCSTGSFMSAMSRPFVESSPSLQLCSTDDNEGCDALERPFGFSYVPSPSFPSPTITSSLVLLDLRGSQRLTDRGLLQLHSLYSLEVVKLDNCHSVVGKGLIAFTSSNRLHAVSLANCRHLSDEGVINISHLQSITSLSLDGCRCITNQSLEAISNLVNLEKLDLSQCDLISNEGITSLRPLELLSELSLGWCRLLDDSGIEELVMQQPARRRLLKVLRLSRLPITDNGVSYLGKLVSLVELDLNGCSRIGSVALGVVLEKLVNLTSLDVSYCPSILMHSWQGKVNTLKNLDLCYSGVRDSHLNRFSFLPALEELNLDSCLISDSSIAHLAENNVTPNLISLDLADTDITDSGMMHIVKFQKLKKLSLFYCSISNAGLRCIALLSCLEELNLDSRDVSDQGLSYLINLPKLKALDIFSGRITDYGCVHLSKVQSLESLELCGGGITDRGCSFLGSLENLTSLNLSQNERITNRGAAALAALGNLRALNLSNTRVNSGALRFFRLLVRLQSLALYGCDGVDNDSINVLQNELPSLKCLRLQNTCSDIYTSNDFGDDGIFEDDEEDTDMLLLAETEGVMSHANAAESAAQLQENQDQNEGSDNDQIEDFQDFESNSLGISHAPDDYELF